MPRTTVIGVAVGVLAAVTATPLLPRDNGSMIWDFDELKPSPELDWKPCFENFTCTKLEVPLDYADPSVGKTGIAFLKYSSQNPSAEDILINTGGPGGSGTGDLLQALDAFLEKLGDQYNIIGMDPRGVNKSGPSVTCFPGGPEASIPGNIFHANTFKAVDGSTEYELNEGFQASGAYGDWCSAVHAENKTAGYANTVAVATDMLTYIEAKAKSCGQDPKEAKLWYYGISYGTVLGATYATLFPERIERLIIDGVVDSEEYYNGGWYTALTDTDKAVKTLWSYCFEAGPELCPFHKNASSPEELEQRFKKIFESLKESPISAVDPLLRITPVTISWQDISSYILGLTYFPITGFPMLAQMFAELEEGNLTTTASSDIEATFLVPTSYDNRYVRTQTPCFDQVGRTNISTIEKYAEHVKKMNEMSSYGGPQWSANFVAPCRNLNVFVPESQILKDTPSANKTSAPILLIGNTRDPVTPLRSAKKMSSLFPGSEVLTLDATGHTTFGFASKCTNDHVKAYLADASLPPPDTVCEWDEKPFIDVPGGTGASMMKRNFF